MTRQSFTPLPQHKSPPDAGTSRIALWVVLLGVAFWPRLWILGFWIFDHRGLGQAFSSWVIPALGFFVLPWTTLLYAFMWSVGSDAVSGWEWSFVVLAFIVDVWFWIAARRSLR
jgi:hypothetical protein